MCVVTSASGLRRAGAEAEPRLPVGRREEPEQRRRARRRPARRSAIVEQRAAAARGSSSSAAANGLNSSSAASASGGSFQSAAVAASSAAPRVRRLRLGRELPSYGALRRPRVRLRRLDQRRFARRRAPRPRARCAASISVASAALGSAPRLDRRRFGDAAHARSARPIVGSAAARRLGILVPAMLARRAAHLPALGRDRAILHHILGAAIRAGEDH